LVQKTATTKVTYCLQLQNGEHWSTLRSLTPEAGSPSAREKKLQRKLLRWRISNHFGLDALRIITVPYVDPREEIALSLAKNPINL
ncbi:MAG: hypothetical protein ABL893_04755, partial [Hyphomicrobium sp.]